MSTGYQPKPTTPTPTGMHQVIPNRGPSIVAVRQGFEDTFGAYVPPDWALDAECTQPGTDPETFYPQRGGRSGQRATAACAVCIVREDCLLDALKFEVGELGAEDVRPEVHGIRGGMVQKNRLKLVQAIRTGRVAMPTSLEDLEGLENFR